MLGSIRIKGRDIRRLYTNNEYRIYIVNKSIFIKMKLKEGWKLRYEIVFSKHNLAQYLKYKLSFYNDRGYENHYIRISTCTELNELINKNCQVPMGILQEMDEFLDATELYNKMEMNI